MIVMKGRLSSGLGSLHRRGYWNLSTVRFLISKPVETTLSSFQGGHNILGIKTSEAVGEDWQNFMTLRLDDVLAKEGDVDVMLKSFTASGCHRSPCVLYEL